MIADELIIPIPIENNKSSSIALTRALVYGCFKRTGFAFDHASLSRSQGFSQDCHVVYKFSQFLSRYASKELSTVIYLAGVLYVQHCLAPTSIGKPECTFKHCFLALVWLPSRVLHDIPDFIHNRLAILAGEGPYISGDAFWTPGRIARLALLEACG